MPFGTLKVIKSKRKITPTKTSMKEKYITFYNMRAKEYDFTSGTPEEKAEIQFKFIYIDNIEFKEEQSISLIYSKEFKEQFKNLGI